MIAKLAKLANVARLIGFAADDDTQIRAAVEDHMNDETVKAALALADGDTGFSYEDHALALEKTALAYDDANYQEQTDEEPPSAVMRRLAMKFRRMGKMGAPPPPAMADDDEAKKKMAAMADDEAKKMAAAPPDEMAAAADEPAKQAMARAFAQQLGVPLAAGLSSAQMLSALTAAAMPTSRLPQMVAEQVKVALADQDRKIKMEATARDAKVLVEQAVRGGYPSGKSSDLLRAASDPALFEAIKASVEPYLRIAGKAAGAMSLFEQTVFAGAPTGSNVQTLDGATGPDRRSFRNELGTFVEHGGRFSAMAIEMADSADPKIQAKVNALLGDAERKHAGLRLIAANRVLKAERPDLWEAAEGEV